MRSETVWNNISRINTTYNFLREWTIRGVILLVAVALGAAQTISVKSYGAVGDGATDDSPALQACIDDSPEGATIDFGDSSSVYFIGTALWLGPNRTYVGAATILLGAQAPTDTGVMRTRYGQSDNIRIEGLTLDAHGVSGAILLAVGGDSLLPARNVTITGCVFRNTRSPIEGGWQSAIYTPVGLDGGSIASNHFVNCGAGIYLSNPNRLAVTANDFDTITNHNAIFLAFQPAAFETGKALSISGNKGRNLQRMAIELWGGGGAAPEAPEIDGNVFSAWSPLTGGEGFGISVVTATRPRITNNELTGGVGPLGIELGAAGATVSGNHLTGFQSGIVLQHGCSGSVIRDNVLEGQQSEGILFSNAAGQKDSIRVISNRIVNPQQAGIMVNTTRWPSVEISNNTVVRSGGFWPGDGKATFVGIGTTPPDAPVRLTGNTIVQDAVSPPAGFVFQGIRLNGGSGAFAGSLLDSNTILSRSSGPRGSGLLVGAPGSLDGAVVVRNVFQNLGWVTDGAVAIPAVSYGNAFLGCLNRGPVGLQ
jgi:hypothetical protein